MSKNQEKNKIFLNNIHELKSTKLSILRFEKFDSLIVNENAQSLKINDITFECITSYFANNDNAFVDN